jgi:DNA-binding transcriptional LysR family regulator
MDMLLSSLHLEAFAAVAREQHFSNAAKSIGITQSALSLRIKNLEEELGTTLFIRRRSGAQITDAGMELLRYYQLKESLELEVTGKFKAPKDHSLNGVIRIGGYSSVMRSLILPKLSHFLKSNPKVQLYFLTREVEDIPSLLKRGEIDYAILDRNLETDQLVSLNLGEEEYVLVQSKKANLNSDVYLDHDERDETTFKFLKLQKQNSSKIRRHYLDDVYGILDGVRQGLGKAVLPKHLIKDFKDLEIDPVAKPMKIPIVLHYYRQPYYSILHHTLMKNWSR